MYLLWKMHIQKLSQYYQNNWSYTMDTYKIKLTIKAKNDYNKIIKKK